MTGSQITIKTFALNEISEMETYLSSTDTDKAGGKEILSIQCAGAMWVVIHKNTSN